MKSKRIRIHNIPQDTNFYEKSIHVKPTTLILFLFLLGALVIVIRPYYAIIGASLIMLSIFCILVMPDRVLCRFSKDYFVVYNQRDRTYCKILYWDEILSWQYEWHNTYDQLVISMVDGSVEMIEMYNYRSIKKYMLMHAKDKMKKPIRVRKELVA